MMQQTRRPLEPHADRVNKSKTNLHHARDITPKRVTSGEAHLRCFAPGQHKNVAAVTSHCQHCVRFDRSGNRTPDLSQR